MITEHIEIIEPDSIRVYKLTHDESDYSVIREFIASVVSKDMSFVSYPITVTIIISRESC